MAARWQALCCVARTDNAESSYQRHVTGCAPGTEDLEITERFGEVSAGGLSRDTNTRSLPGTKPLKRNSLDSCLHKTTTKPPLQQSIPPKITWDGQGYMGWIQGGWITRLRAPGQSIHYKRPASDPTHYDSASVNIGVKANGLESTHNHLAGDPTHYEYIGVKAKLLAQLLAGS
ncbi:hypothetical protein B0H14DRAFT_3128836 [Mycena olivaceomarginata]|nr:hypothetical protein B0H14DRAFT_3128836 [Mycena olivaceomarginata]